MAEDHPRTFVATADAGDYRFLLMQEIGGGGKFHCIRHPTDDERNTEELTELQEIPTTVLSVFKKHM